MPAAGSTSICQWPRRPALPPRGQAVLVRVAVPATRPAARHALRAVLRQVLAAWSGLPPEQLPLAETPRGPVWQGQLGGEPLDISLSYSASEGWIGLIRGGWIGVDVMSAEPFAELDSVSRRFLDPAAAAAIRGAADPALAFATAWTEREARLKCLKRALVEWTATQAQAEAECSCHKLVFGVHLAGAVSWKSDAAEPLVNGLVD